MEYEHENKYLKVYCDKWGSTNMYEMLYISEKGRANFAYTIRARPPRRGVLGS